MLRGLPGWTKGLFVTGALLADRLVDMDLFAATALHAGDLHILPVVLLAGGPFLFLFVVLAVQRHREAEFDGPVEPPVEEDKSWP